MAKDLSLVCSGHRSSLGSVSQFEPENSDRATSVTLSAGPIKFSVFHKLARSFPFFFPETRFPERFRTKIDVSKIMTKNLGRF